MLLKTDNPPAIMFISDSELLVKQMKGLYRVKNPILACIKRAIDETLENIPHQFKHVLRKKNIAADALANQGVDRRIKLPPKLAQFSVEHDLPL